MESSKILVPGAITVFAVLLLAYLAFAGLGKELTIRGENIEVQGTSPLTVRGSFYIGPPVGQVVDVPGHGPTTLTVPSPTILSHGTGGACLIADLNFKGIPDLGGKCQADLDCTNAIPQKYTGNYTDEHNNTKVRGWHSYCVDGTCWTRPGQQGSHCLISAAHNNGDPWPTGSHPFGPPAVSASAYTIADLYRELGIDGPVQWRVHACMNGSRFTTDNTACKGNLGHRLIDDGPTYSVP